MILRYWWLIDDDAKRKKAVNIFFQRLLRRGYTGSFLTPLFNIRITKAKQQTPNDLVHEKEENKMESTVFLHLPFNPADSTSHDIQKIFKKKMLTKDENCATLPKIKNYSGQPMSIDRLVVAYSKQKNLKNLVFPRKFDSSAGSQISHYINDEKFKGLIKSKK